MESQLKQNEGIPQRLTELDLAKGFSILFMVAVHTLECFEPSWRVWKTTYGSAVEFLGGIPAAPVFMFALGAGVCFSRNNAPLTLLKRGLVLLLLGYSLNFFRGFLPCLLGMFLYDEPRFMNWAWRSLLEIDILQFAGLTFLFFALVSRFKFNIAFMAVSAIVLPLLHIFLKSLSVSGLPLIALTGLIWGVGRISYFPFLSWIFYPLAGYLFGRLIRSQNNRNRFYLISFAVSAAMLLIMILLFRDMIMKDIGKYDDYGYYYHSIVGNFAFTFFVIAWISLLYFLSKIAPKLIIKTWSRWSANIKEFYFIHWVILGWLMFIVNYEGFPLHVCIIITISVFVAADLLSSLFNKWRRTRKAVSLTE